MDRDSAPSFHFWRTSRFFAPLLISWAGFGIVGAGTAHALGVDGPLTQSALGQALNLVFPVVLKPGEMLASECVQAEVYAGEARVPPGLVQLVLEGESEGAVRAVRLYSSMPINEPLVHVTLSLGCPTRLSRQYTAFIDPPGLDQGARGGPTSPAPRPPQYSLAMRAALGAAGAHPESLLAGAANSSPDLRPPALARVPSPRRSERVTAATAPLPSGDAAPQGKAFRTVGIGALKEGRSTAEGAARLRLAPPDAEEAAQSPLAQIAAAEQALLRLRQLEETLNRLAQDNQISRNQAQALRKQLATAPAEESSQMPVLLLAALSLALAGLSAFLWLSRQRERAARDAAWWASGRSEVAEPAEPRAGAVEEVPPPAWAADAAEQAVHDDAAVPGRPTSLSVASPNEPYPVGPADERTITLPPAEAGEAAGEAGVASLASASSVAADDPNSGPLSIQLLDTPANFVNDTGVFTAPVPLNVTAAGTDHVTVEELIDLEQQVEFFLVLGQSDAAVELLQARINFGGASALPYLKLLEIHQRQGDELYFKEVAGSFAKRFDALAPTWGSDLNLGRDLEAYASVLQRVQSRWSDAAASMALLQELLSKGGEAGLGFDLPAYRELLFLYSVARDRSEHEVRSEEIDLFLPLDAQNQPGDGHQLMATMIWQGKEMPGPQHALEVDISLDDEPAPFASSQSGSASRH